MADPVLNRNAARFIPVAKPWITAAEEKNVGEAVAAARVSSGPYVEDFEKEFAAAHDCRYGIACNSGTTALRLALAALDIKPGDRVALPTMTMVACANVILEAGAIPVFVESESLAAVGNIDVPLAIRTCFEQKCSAIIMPHLYGHPIEFREQDFPCPVIEDAAECHYGRFANADSVGTRSTMACFSFFGNKIITTGEGGMVICRESLLNTRLRKLRAHAFSEAEHFNHTEHAFGFRMGDMSGALGLAQHRRSSQILNARVDVANWYGKHLAEIETVELPNFPEGGVCWVYPVHVKNDHWHRPRDDFRTACHAAGIETRTYFRPLHRQRHLLKFAPPDAEGRFQNADAHWRRGFYLPLYPEMTEDDVIYICNVLRSV